jgi:hypothetical protein
VLLGDRNFAVAGLMPQIAATGAALLIRCNSNRRQGHKNPHSDVETSRDKGRDTTPVCGQRSELARELRDLSLSAIPGISSLSADICA